VSGALPHAIELRVGAEPSRIDADDLVADCKLGDGGANRFDLAGKFGPWDSQVGSPDRGEDVAGGDERIAEARDRIDPLR
jgi:hypothetical protein